MTAHPHANLLEAARRGDRSSREQLCAAYLPVVRSITLRYRDLGVPLDDLAQEGALGLLEAIDRFDPERSSDFEAFARFRIRRAIRNALTEQSRLIRLPKQVVERRRAIDVAEGRLLVASGRPPTCAEIAAVTGLTAESVAATRGIGSPPISLDQAVLDDGTPLESHVIDHEARDPAVEAAEHQEVAAVDDAIHKLPERQREIVERHFGVGRDPEQMADVAESLHVSQQRARAIERDALYTLRDGLDSLVVRLPDD